MKLYTDGGARGNPGPAAGGVVLINDGGNVIKKLGFALGVKTNNEAEYKALIRGLRTSLDEEATHLKCYLDSELVVKQLRGEYRVKNANMKPLWNEAKELEKKFKNVEYFHITRDKNKQADLLVNEVLDANE